ncbi:hypothetical protein GIY23_16340 [Allosaccharopolyspora coralli]|uniref:Uncharacterized protein n=1 Tax=Allosaccharopolyspora coralli TaxID=2665642 RepID=A0A5Q3QBY3_9PSEU|nr:hypothetical protein [Allosaccharopolyspora coralli]QGK70876.1 hypothetical protein GIY23_16340 [Allosaccharopolyspora coralli]
MSTSLSRMAVAAFALAPALGLSATSEAAEPTPPAERSATIVAAYGGPDDRGPGGGMGYDLLGRLLRW